jgi:vacuolar-type H+-ATPase subunit H
MAELTNLETKLGEVIGLAMASQTATERVEKLTEDRQLKKALQTMRKEAEKAEKDASALAATFDGKKGKIMKEARSVKTKGATMMKTYLERDADELDGFEFLTMAEAGEVGHWAVLEQLNKQAKHPGVRALVREQLPIQRRHFKEVNAASLQLAAKEDPNAEG